MVFQCILAGKTHSDPKQESYFWAAQEGSIYTINQWCDEVVSVWPKESEIYKAHEEDTDGHEADAPSSKRRKVSHDEQRSNVIKLLRTENQQYLIAVTAEDKCIRVFCIHSNGELEPLSERCMPKRPSAIALTPDDTTIVVGDKFGDAYALPLLESARKDEDKIQETPAKAYKPAATHLNVHSAKNRRALEAQLKIKEHVKTKEPLKFSHELLLGHVSMLTDMVLAVVDKDTDKAREYIITADRDEHIRVTRGQPQTHIIEGFCLGHKQFINRLCLIGQNKLVSAGGEDEIYVWDWQHGRLLYNIDIGTTVRKFRDISTPSSTVPENVEHNDDSGDRIAVSGLWTIRNKLLVACEGMAGFVYIDLDSLLAERGHDSLVHFHPLPCNLLDVAIMADTIVLSIDNVHQPWSTSAIRSPETRTAPLYLLKFEQYSAESQPVEVVNAAFKLSNQIHGEPSVKGGEENKQANKGFWELIYHVENLRKRGVGDEE